MVVAETMSKPTLKVSVSSDSSSEDESESQSDEEVDQEPILDDAEADAEDNESSDGQPEEDSMLVTNEGWADSVAKILGSTKPKNKKTLVLSRAKKHSEVLKSIKDEKPAFEVVGEEKENKLKREIKEEESTSEPSVKKPKIEKPSIRVKPNILEKDRERLLTKIATKGVVQLFNAVRNQQKSLEKDMNRTDLSEAKKEKILKKFDKRAFLDTLMGQTKSIVVDEQTKSLKDEVKDENDTPKWSALRDDFMMGAKMKDWDKESVDD